MFIICNATNFIILFISLSVVCSCSHSKTSTHLANLCVSFLLKPNSKKNKFLLKMPKGKCVWNENIRVKYPYFQKGKNDSSVFCTKCNSDFSIASGGNADIDRHIKRPKHLDAVLAAAGVPAITSHFQATVDKKLAAQEGVWAYHVVNSNHSFASSDCASKILRECFDIKKFSCSQTKCRAIIVNVFAPHAQELLKNELKECRYVSLYTDASNHGNIKLFPVMVRYFRPLEGLFVKMLDISSQTGENSDIIVQLLTTAVSEYELKKN
jgi:hypothetical protein